MTLKVRLLIAVTVVAGFLLAGSWAVTRTTSSYLFDQVDEQLVRFASGPAGFGPREPPPDQTGAPPSEAAMDSSDPGAYSAVYVGTLTDGELVTRVSPQRGTSPAAVPKVSVRDAERLAGTGAIETFDSSAAGTRYRVTARVGRNGGIVVVGVPLDGVDSTVSRLVRVEALATGIVLAALGLIAWWVLRLGVGPVRRMTAAAATIAAGDLSHRVTEEAPGTEAHDLGVALNTMLERIEDAFAERAATEERLRRFVADASHELRTPITTVRGYAELYRLGGLDDPERLDAAMARTEAETVRMGGLVEGLLTLARMDQGVAVEAVPVDLAGVVTAAAADLRVRHPEHPVSLDVRAATVTGDSDRLHQVVANLLTNAAVHTPPGTAVEVTLRSSPSGVRLVVRDHGPGLDEVSAVKAFERFWRADPSRSRSSGGSGLGLSIVAAIVGAMGGTVRLDRPAEGTGTAAVVELPVAAQPS